MSGAAARECAGSFSSVSSNNTASREVEEEFLQHQQRQFHIKPLLGSPPEMGTDDGDLQRVTGPSEPPPPALPTVKKKRSLPGTPGACVRDNSYWRLISYGDLQAAASYQFTYICSLFLGKSIWCWSNEFLLAIIRPAVFDLCSFGNPNSSGLSMIDRANQLRL